MPGGVGIGEIGPGVEVFRERFEGGELFAVVEGEGCDEGEINGTERGADRAADGVRALGGTFRGDE